MPQGAPDLRIALIHSVYGAGWAIVSLAAGGGVSPWPAAAMLLFASVCAIGAARQIRKRGVAGAPLDPKAGRWLRRINVTTAVAALLYGTALSASGHDGMAIAAVLIVLGVHFLPLWWLLRRPSLLAMGVALGAIGGLVWHAPAEAATGAFFAALLFAGNGVRLLLSFSSAP